MTTPEQARKLAEFKGTDNLPCNVRDALRDLAQQVEELQADAERLEVIRMNLEPAESVHWLPDWCLEGELAPTQDQFRAFLDKKNGM